MSVYITMQGDMTFPNKEAYDKAVGLLVEGGWMKEGFLIDECGDKMGNTEDDFPAACSKSLSITFPFGLYRNIGALIDLIRKGTKGRIVWTTTDGGFQGGVISDGEEALTDLEKWGKEQKIEYQREDGESDAEANCQWANMVEFAFHEENAP